MLPLTDVTERPVTWFLIHLIQPHNFLYQILNIKKSILFMTDHLFQTWLTRYIIFLSILTYYVKYIQKEKEIKSTTYFCSFSSSWLQTCEFFICWKRNLWNRFKIKTVADSCVHSSDISSNLKWMKINLNFCYPVSTSSCVKGSFLPLKSFSINLYILLPQQCCFSDSPTPCERYYCFTYLGTLTFQPRHNHVFWPVDVLSNY